MRSEPWGRGTALGLRMGSGCACFGPEKMPGVGLGMEKDERLEGGGVGDG